MRFVIEPCCISLKTGAMIISIFQMVLYGLAFCGSLTLLILAIQALGKSVDDDEELSWFQLEIRQEGVFYITVFTVCIGGTALNIGLAVLLFRAVRLESHVRVKIWLLLTAISIVLAIVVLIWAIIRNRVFQLLPYFIYIFMTGYFFWVVCEFRKHLANRLDYAPSRHNT